MQIPADLKAVYNAYRKECLAKKVEPVTSDFLLGDPPHWQRAYLQRASDDLIAAEYNLYVAVCLAKNVEPVLRDFLAGEIPESVVAVMEHVQNEVEPERKETLATSA